ncbi:hypothetical protein D3C81_1684170 [compost metagenome]
MLGKHGNNHGDTHAAIGRFADTHHEAGKEHLLIVLGQRATEGRQAPEHGHQRQAFDPAETVCEQGQGERQQADHQGDDAAEQAELTVAQRPLALEHGEHGVKHLPRHVV